MQVGMVFTDGLGPIWNNPSILMKKKWQASVQTDSCYLQG